MMFDFTRGKKAEYSVHRHYTNAHDCFYFHYKKEAKEFWARNAQELTNGERVTLYNERTGDLVAWADALDGNIITL